MKLFTQKQYDESKGEYPLLFKCDKCGIEFTRTKNQYACKIRWDLHQNPNRNIADRKNYCSPKCVKKKEDIKCICTHCQKEFIEHTTKEHIPIKPFCSQTCRASYYNQRREKRLKKICAECSKEYMGWNRNSKYCSSKCSSKNHDTRVLTKCDKCGKDIWKRSKKLNTCVNIFCSNKCKNSFYLGTHIRGNFSNNGYNNKSCVSTYRILAFKTYEHKCYYCGYNKHNSLLQVHHMDGNRNNNTKENLKIVCPTCHGEIHLGLLK